jgi:hypothetical protein
MALRLGAVALVSIEFQVKLRLIVLSMRNSLANLVYS